MASRHIYKEYGGGELVVSAVSSGVDGRSSENPYSGDVFRQVKQKSVQQDRNGSAPNYTWDTSLAAPVFRYNTTGMSYTDIPANQEQALLSRLTEAIRGHSFNAAIFIGEGKESLTTIVRTAKAVLGAFNRLRKGDFAGCCSYLGGLPGQRALRDQAKKRFNSGDISGTWLSLKYGWLPLVADCFEAAEAFQKRQEARATVFRVSTALKGPRRNISSDAYVKIWCDNVSSLKVKCIVTENPSTLRNLGLLNPVSLVWELLPFSFVVDWFAPIGDWLDNWSYLGSLKATFVRSHWRKSTAMFNPSGPVYASATTRYVGGFYSHNRVVFNRTVGPLAGVPTPSLKDMSRICSFGHIANAAALIHQAVASARKPVLTKRFKPGELAGRWRNSAPTA